MNHWDYLLIAAILLAVVWAVRVCVGNHAQGKHCSGDCASCGRSCKK